MASSHDTGLKRSPEERLGDLVLPYGYPLEAHQLQTEDGYILSLFRIPASPQRQPVLLQHGLLDSCAGFLLNGPQQSLAFILADAGRRGLCTQPFGGRAGGGGGGASHGALQAAGPQTRTTPRERAECGPAGSGRARKQPVTGGRRLMLRCRCPPCVCVVPWARAARLRRVAGQCAGQHPEPGACMAGHDKRAVLDVLV